MQCPLCGSDLYEIPYTGVGAIGVYGRCLCCGLSSEETPPLSNKPHLANRLRNGYAGYAAGFIR